MKGLHQFFVAFVKEANLLDATGVTALENAEGADDVPADILAKVKAGFVNHIATVEANATKAGKDEGYGRGKREALTDLESKLKETYGVNSTKTGLELIADVITEKVGTGGTKSMTEEELKKLPFVAQLTDKLAQAQTQINDLTSANTELTTFKTQAESRELNTFVYNEALKVFNGLNPVLPDDENAKSKHIKIFENAILNGGKYKIEEVDGKQTIFITDEGGNYINNQMKSGRLTFAEHVKNVATDYFAFQKQDGKAAPGNGGGSGGDGAGGGSTFVVPAMNSEQDFTREIEKPGLTPEQRSAVKVAWVEKNKTN
jgi:hypothetical protein